jgi:hypothetical protein
MVFTHRRGKSRAKRNKASAAAFYPIPVARCAIFPTTPVFKFEFRGNEAILRRKEVEVIDLQLVVARNKTVLIKPVCSSWYSAVFSYGSS